MKDYLQESARTCTDTYPHMSTVPAWKIAAALKAAVRANALVDAIKKKVIYNKASPIIDHLMAEPDHVGIQWSIDHIDPAQVHHILGVMSEAVELGELLLEAMETGLPIDPIDIKDEVGDNQWYNAGLIRSIDSTFDAVHESNIAKLKVRFPVKFTEDQAINKDAKKELAAVQ